MVKNFILFHYEVNIVFVTIEVSQSNSNIEHTIPGCYVFCIQRSLLDLSSSISDELPDLSSNVIDSIVSYELSKVNVYNLSFSLKSSRSDRLNNPIKHN